MVFAFLKPDNSALFGVLKRYGFKATSDKNWQKLMSGIALLDSHQLTHFKVRQEIKHLRAQCVKNHDANAMKTLLRLNQFILPVYMSWQKQQVAFFNNLKWWEVHLQVATTLEQPAREKALQTIPILRQLWEQQSHYALYSTWDLINVYEAIFPLFREWLSYAKIELKQKGHYLPERILRNYQQYLTNVEKSLAYEEQQIRTALKARLVAGLIQQNAQFDEVISVIQHDLQSLGILAKPERSPYQETSGYMTPRVFLKMQQIIERDATKDEKTDWYSLAYNTHRDLSNKAVFNNHYRATHQGHTYRIPSELATHIPEELPSYLYLPWFLHWFFITDQLIYTFLQNATCQYLLAIEQSLMVWVCPQKISLLDLEKHTAWQGLQHLWAYLESEKERTQITQKNLFIFSRSEVTPLLDGYQTHLHQLANDLLSKQIAMLSCAIEPFNQKILMEEEKKQLEVVLQDLRDTEKSWKRTSDLSGQLSILILHCHHLLNRPVVTTKTLETATAAIDQLSRGEKVTSEALNAIKTTQDSLALGQDVSEADSYKETRFSIETYLVKEKIPNLLKTELLEKPLHQDQKTLTLHLQKLTTYHTWVLREKPSLMDPAVLNDQICYYTSAFLQSIQDLSSKEAFLAKITLIQQVVRTIQHLTETTFSPLHDALVSVAKMDITQPLYRSGWKFFCQIELEPPLNTLKEYLMKRGLAPNVSREVNIATPENSHTFKKVFKPMPTSTKTNQTDDVSFESTFTQ
jgi:hypothetical protein